MVVNDTDIYVNHTLETMIDDIVKTEHMNVLQIQFFAIFLYIFVNYLHDIIVHIIKANIKDDNTEMLYIINLYITVIVIHFTKYHQIQYYRNWVEIILLVNKFVEPVIVIVVNVNYLFVLVVKTYDTFLLKEIVYATIFYDWLYNYEKIPFTLLQILFEEEIEIIILLV